MQATAGAAGENDAFAFHARFLAGELDSTARELHFYAAFRCDSPFDPRAWLSASPGIYCNEVRYERAECRRIHATYVKQSGYSPRLGRTNIYNACPGRFTVAQTAKSMPAALLIRVSSLGDVVQTFPAVTDMGRYVKDLSLDWLVEETYVPLVRMHGRVAHAIPFALRRWRKSRSLTTTWREVSTLRQSLRCQPYDVIIESQGLLKSVAPAKYARGPIYGFGPKTVREPFVSRFYDHTFEFPPDVHRIWHYRGLAAKTFGYELDDAIDYGLTKPARPAWLAESDYVVLLHSTARSEKLWSEASWIEVGRWLASRGVACVLPWGNPDEHARAERLASLIPDAQVAPQLRVDEAGALLAHARAVIGVDTGLMHLAVAFEVPVVGIYLATRPLHHGPLGRGPTAFRGGMGDTPTPTQVLDALGEVAPDLA